MSCGRTHRTRRCVGGCHAVVAHCAWTLPDGSACGAGLCVVHVRGGPGAPLCPAHGSLMDAMRALEEGDRPCASGGFAIGPKHAGATDIYCSGCRAVVPVRDGRVVRHARAA